MPKWLQLGLVLTVLSPGFGTVWALTADELAITNGNGVKVNLQNEDLTGLTAQPLIKTRNALDKEFGPGFMSLFKIAVKSGDKLTGRYTVRKGPCRITIYQISKAKDQQRKLRVVASGFYQTGALAEFSTTAEILEENVYFITAEAVASREQLNSHLKYMNAEKNEILLKGYSTNWNLSALKLKLAGGKECALNSEFVKDADWLVRQLLKPQWVSSIRFDVQ